MQNTYGIKTNFLNIASLKNSIKSFLLNLEVQKEASNPKPIHPHNIKIFCTQKKGTKDIYNILTAENIIPMSIGTIRWGKSFNMSETKWKKIFIFPFVHIKNSKLQWLQFRINNHILVTNSFLFKIGKVHSNICSFCQNNEETILHLLWECLDVRNLLSRFTSICETKEVHFTLDRESFI